MNLVNQLYKVISYSTPRLNFSTTTASAIKSTSSTLKPQPKPQKAFLKISDTAAEQIQQLMKGQVDQNYIGVQIGIQKRGCNGLQYTMNYVEKQENQLDEMVEEKGVLVIIDNKAVMNLVGTEMDYIDDEIRSEFVFQNPNSKGTCGCGESFYI